MNTERDQLITLCQRLGADGDGATTMADQLLKRCDQLVAQRGLSRPAAMEYLLRLVMAGRQGVTPPGFEATTPPPNPETR